MDPVILLMAANTFAGVLAGLVLGWAVAWPHLQRLRGDVAREKRRQRIMVALFNNIGQPENMLAATLEELERDDNERE